MKRLNRLVATIVLSAVVLLAATAGCQKQAASPSDAVAAKKQPTPEESFQLVFETFRRGVETGAGGVPSGFIASDDDGHSRFRVNNQVSHELIPPAKDNEPYRASITVVSSATYSIARGLGDDDEDGESDENQQRPNGAPGDSSAADSTGVLDPGLVSTDGAQAQRSSSNSIPVARRDDTSKRTFDLVYENGRWALTEESKKQLDPKTEQAIIKAFDKALGSQV